jgi:hypothetical protein
VCGAKTPPTATEAFNLRIRCKQMADEKADAVAWHEMTVAKGAAIGMSAADVARINDTRRRVGAGGESRGHATGLPKRFPNFRGLMDHLPMPAHRTAPKPPK